MTFLKPAAAKIFIFLPAPEKELPNFAKKSKQRFADFQLKTRNTSRTSVRPTVLKNAAKVWKRLLRPQRFLNYKTWFQLMLNPLCFIWTKLLEKLLLTTFWTIFSTISALESNLQKEKAVFWNRLITRFTLCKCSERKSFYNIAYNVSWAALWLYLCYFADLRCTGFVWFMHSGLFGLRFEFQPACPSHLFCFLDFQI